MRLALIAVAVALPLAACSKSDTSSATGQAAGTSADAGSSGASTAASDAVDSAAIAKASDFKLTPGKWETSTEIVDLRIAGMPDGMPASAMKDIKPPRTTVTTCITPEQAAHPQADMLAAQKDNHCTVSKMEMGSGRMNIAMSCAPPQGQGTSTVLLTGRYDAMSYEMSGDMAMAGPNGMKMTMTSRTAGKRIGDCAAK